MSGFHPILGLLAVAVCISFTAGAAFSFNQNDETSVRKLHESSSGIPRFAERHDTVQVRSLNENRKDAHLRKDNDHQSQDISGRNAAYNNRASGFDGVTNLRTAGETALRRHVAAADGTSGSIDDKSTRNGGLVRTIESNHDEEKYSSSSEESDARSQDAQSEKISLLSVVSPTEEDCEDVNENKHSAEDATTSSPPSTPPEQTSDSNREPTASTAAPEQGPDDECDHTEPSNETVGSGTESSSQQTEVPQSEECDKSDESSSQDQAKEVTGSEQSQPTEAPTSDECEETEEPNNQVTSTTPTKPHKKPTYSEESWDPTSETEEGGYQFSGSSSDENTGESRDASWRR